MKRKSLLFALLLAIGLPWAANAQSLSTYSVTVGTETYSSIADNGGTLLSSVTGDGGSQTVTLPFDFPFGETTFTSGTTLTVRADGYLYFGSSNPGHSSKNAWTSTSSYRIISPFFNSDGRIDRSGGPDGAAYYAVVNDASNNPEMLVIEFVHLECYYSPYGDYNFQVRLHKNGNISAVYETSTLSTYSSASQNFFLFNGSSDKVCLEGSYASPTAGTPSSLPNFTTAPVAGEVITYVRPVITCPKPTLTDVNTSTDYASLRWTENGTATIWKVEYSTSSDFSANVKSKTFQNMPAGSITDLNPGTTYYVRVIAMCEPGVDESFPSNVLSFNTECDILYVTEQNPYEQNFDGVTGTTSGTTNNLPLCWNYINETSYSSYAGYPVVYNSSSYAHSGNNYLRLYSYYYYSSYSSTNYDPQDQYAIMPEMQGVNSLRMKLYARAYSTSSSYSTYDATFHVGVMTNPADATTFTEVATYTPTTTTYELYTIPFSSYTGTGHYIAIMIEAAETGSSTFYRTVCIDDIVVEPIPSCVEPDTPEYVAGSADTESAKVTWTPNGNETSWDLYWSASETAPTATTTPTAEGVTMTDNEYTINGLTANTTYYVWVRAHCSATSQSPWSGPCSFTTPCDAITITDSWSENFNSLTAGIPNCWDNSEGTTTTEYLKWNYYATGHDGACVRFNSYSNSSGNTNFLKTPTLNFATGKVMQLTFWYKNPTGGNFSVYISTDGGNTHTTALVTGLTGASSWTQQEINLTNYVDAENVVIVFKGTSNYGSGDAYIYLDDVAIVPAPSCLKPTDLAVTANSITSGGATITWTAGGSETQWQIEFATDADFTNPLYETVNADPDDEAYVPTYTFHGLNESTTYYVHVQAVCGGNDGSSEYSDPVSFTTLQTAVNLPYVTDFESGNDWLLVNGNLTNAWAYGTANNNGGTHALYISNDGGTTNAYGNNSTIVYATKLFNFEAGIYVFSYDWIANGESSWDYLRAALVPSSVQLAATTSYPNGFSSTSLPTGWIALDGGGKLNLQQEWQSFATNEMEIAAGTYMMVFAWRNDGSTNNNPPAAIDNVSIAKITCTTPADLEAPQSGITATSAQLSWTETGEATAWEIELTDEEDHVTTIPVDEDDLVEGVYTIRDLSSEKVYSVRVRANCGDGYSNWSDEEIFETAEDCQMSDGLAAVAYTNSAVISWNGYGQEEFNLRYGTDGETWTTEPRVTNNYTLADLTPATTYYVQVQPTCADAETWSEGYTFHTLCESITAFPWSEGFEDGELSFCWDQDQIVGTSAWSVGTGDYNASTGSHTGNYNAKITYISRGNVTKLITPVLDLTSLNHPMLTFWYINRKWSSDIDGFAVYYRTASDAAWTQIDATEDEHETWTKATYMLPNKSATYQIAFEMTDGYGYGVGIDDVTVEDAPTFRKAIDGYADNENPDGGFYLIASPLNEAITPTNVGGMITDNFDLFSYNQGAELEWENYLTHTDDFVIEPGKGYLYASANDTELVFTGVPYNGNGEVTLTVAEAEEGDGLDFPGFNLVGNPLDREAYIDREYYAMKADGSELELIENYSTRTIGIMEGVFVEASSNEDFVTFTTEAPAGGKGLVLNLSQDRGIVDRAVVRYGESPTLHKFMFNQDDTKLYIPENGEDFAVVCKRNSSEVPVNFEPAEDGIYTISVDVRNMNLSSLVLKDYVKNVTVDLLRTPTYLFKASTNDRADRFVLSFRTNNGVYKERIVKGGKSEDFSFENNGTWIIDNEGEATLQVIDLNGRVLSSENIYGSTSIQVDAAPGVYMLRLINGDNVKTQKVVVK